MVVEGLVMTESKKPFIVVFMDGWSLETFFGFQPVVSGYFHFKSSDL